MKDDEQTYIMVHEIRQLNELVQDVDRILETQNLPPQVCQRVSSINQQAKSVVNSVWLRLLQ